MQPVRVSTDFEPEVDFAVIPVTAALQTPLRPADVVLAVDVISSGWYLPDLRERISGFAAAGVPSYWIIDMLRPQIAFTKFVLSGDGTYYQRLHSSGVAMLREP